MIAAVYEDRVSPCGWPESIAEMAHCDLITKATAEERMEMLNNWANKDGPYDVRKSWAQHALTAKGGAA